MVSSFVRLRVSTLRLSFACPHDSTNLYAAFRAVEFQRLGR